MFSCIILLADYCSLVFPLPSTFAPEIWDAPKHIWECMGQCEEAIEAKICLGNGKHILSFPHLLPKNRITNFCILRGDIRGSTQVGEVVRRCVNSQHKCRGSGEGAWVEKTLLQGLAICPVRFCIDFLGKQAGKGANGNHVIKGCLAIYHKCEWVAKCPDCDPVACL